MCFMLTFFIYFHLCLLRVDLLLSPFLAENLVYLVVDIFLVIQKGQTDRNSEASAINYLYAAIWVSRARVFILIMLVKILYSCTVRP